MELSFIEINQNALEYNLKSLKSTLPKDKKIMVIVKGNAYGHGFKEITDIFKEHNLVSWFGVFQFSDAVLLRKITQKPILVLCSTEQCFWHEAAKKNISITISRHDQLIALNKCNQKNKLKVHIKVDTGLGRQGFMHKEISQVSALLLNSGICLEGLYTHFSGTESKKYDSYTVQQFEEFLDWKKSLHEIGQHPITHAGATSGSLRNSRFACDMARFGVGIYGLWPSEEVKTFNKKISLKPVLSFKSVISEIKIIPKGGSVSYDRGVILSTDTKIGVIPVGYYDGLPRELSYKMNVLIKGHRAPILGKVMMNMIVVDISNIPKTKIGDTVTLIGVDKKEAISISDWSFWTSLINYEIVTRLNPLTKRIIKSLQKSQK